MVPEIILMNVRSWGTLGLSTLIEILLRTMGISHTKERNNRQLENNVIINNVVDEIILNETQKVSTRIFGL